MPENQEKCSWCHRAAEYDLMKVDNIAEGQDKPDAICDVCLIGLIADRMANRRIKKDTGRA